MTPLRLTLIKKWFDLIRSGHKPEEYREITVFWARRLLKSTDEYCKPNYDLLVADLLKIPKHCKDVLRAHKVEFKQFSHVEFKNGWARNGIAAPYFNIGFDGIEIGKGREEWGAEDRYYFVIKLGRIK